MYSFFIKQVLPLGYVGKGSTPPSSHEGHIEKALSTNKGDLA